VNEDMPGQVIINYLMALDHPFKNFTVIVRDAILKNPKNENMKKMYELFTELSLRGVADVEFRHNKIFVKGNDEAVAEQLKSNGIAIVGQMREHINLDVDNNLNIIRTLFYRALSRYAEDKGFKMFWGGRRRGRWKRLIPSLQRFDLDTLIEERLADRIGNNLLLFRGLYVMLEIFIDGRAVLWVDLYSPIIKMPEFRPLSPREAKELSLQEKYTRFIPAPLNRLRLTEKLLKMLCEGENLNVRFLDGISVPFVCNFPVIGVEF